MFIMTWQGESTGRIRGWKTEKTKRMVPHYWGTILCA